MAFIVLNPIGNRTSIEPPAFVPSGTMEIDSEGTFEVSNYEFVKVLVEFNDYKQLISSNSVTFLLKRDGTYWSCGSAAYGVQGNGETQTNKMVLSFTQRLTNVKQISGSDFVAFAVKKDGTLWGTGRNNVGQQSTGNTTDVPEFTQRLTNVAKVAVSSDTTWVIKNDRTLWGCGRNDYGQQGSGNTTDVLTFTQRLTDVIDVKVTSEVTWVLRSDGTLWGCGRNNHGQQGSGNTTDVLVFTKRMENVKDFDVSDTSIWVIKNDGTLWGCGLNGGGQQGSGNTTDVLTFIQRLTDVKKVVCSGSRSLSTGTTWALKNDGTLWGCGSKTNGQQGDGDYGISGITKFTQRLTDVIDVACSMDTTWAIKSNKTLWGCGSISYGQQGSGKRSESASLSVKTFTQRLTNVEAVICNTSRTWAIVGYHDLYSCGSNSSGQQSTGSSTSYISTFGKRTV